MVLSSPQVVNGLLLQGHDNDDVVLFDDGEDGVYDDDYAYDEEESPSLPHSGDTMTATTSTTTTIAKSDEDEDDEIDEEDEEEQDSCRLHHHHHLRRSLQPQHHRSSAQSPQRRQQQQQQLRHHHHHHAHAHHRPILSSSLSSSASSSCDANTAAQPPVNDHHAVLTSALSPSSSSLLWQEVTMLGTLSLPTILINLSFMVPHFLTASYVGRHFGPTHLVGYALASVTANIFQGTLLQGLFNASDTLSPQAYGAQNYREVGLLAMRGYVVATILVVIPVNVWLYCYNNNREDGSSLFLVQWFGQDPTASAYAWQYFCWYSLCFPFYTLFNILWKFLAAQTILWPLVYSTLVSTCVVFPCCLQFLGPVLGFVGPAIATTVFYAVQSSSVVFLLWWFQPHHPETWPGLGNCQAWRDALLDWPSLYTYLSLGLGGIIAFMEWVYWEALYLMVGTFGVVPLSAHTIPAAVLDVLYMLPLGIGMALSIRMGHFISHNVAQTKALALGTLTAGVASFAFISFLLFLFQDAIMTIFTNDEDVLAMCREIWPNVCLCFFSLSIYAMVIGISIGLGMQWTLGVVTVISLWCIGMPAAYYFALIQQGGLLAMWTWMWPSYLLISCAMCTNFFIIADWEDVSRQVQEREGIFSVTGADPTITAANVVDDNGSNRGGGNDHGSDDSDVEDNKDETKNHLLQHRHHSHRSSKPKKRQRPCQQHPLQPPRAVCTYGGEDPMLELADLPWLIHYGI